MATPTISAWMQPVPSQAVPTAAQPTSGLSSIADAVIAVDAAQGVHTISPFIYGLNGASADLLSALRPTVNRWGGNPTTRYNWRLGNAWNAGSDWEYRNGDYDYRGASASDDFVRDAQKSSAEVVLTVPTLGWVAKNNDTSTCSFPTDDGGCSDANKATCEKPGALANPKRANVRSDVASIVAWMRHLNTAKLPVRFIAMDNEPELWGYTHYDVHPTCTTYDEIRDTYLAYASAVRAVAPKAELLGPVTCCWYFYWNSAAGENDRAAHDDQDFLPWFLQQVRTHDAKAGTRTLDVLDIHFYPEGLYNNTSDPATDAHRLRSTRALWDPTYTDESWINQPIALIPRMKKLIEQNYPGTKFSMSEWNWGADTTVPGALALADVLGILGREDVYLANYWRYPEPGSPGFYAFKLFTNYDDQGGRFASTSIQATSNAPDRVSAYAGSDASKQRLTLMLINKNPQKNLSVAFQLAHLGKLGKATLFQYSNAKPKEITQTSLPELPSSFTLPAYSLSLFVIEAQQV